MLVHPEVVGPVNAVAPDPVRTREFSRVLGRVLGQRSWMPVVTPFVRMGLGAVTDILVRGQHVTPANALSSGFRFAFPDLEGALRDLVGSGETHGEPTMS